MAEDRQHVVSGRLFFIYFWSLHGAWAIITQKSGKFIPENYSFAHLEDRMFPIDLNQEYQDTLYYYAAFLITVQVLVFLFARTLPPRGVSHNKPIEINHWTMIAVAGALAIATYILVAPRIGMALDQGVAVYRIKYAGGTYKILDSVALMTASLGFSTALCGRRGRYFVGTRSWLILCVYLGLIVSLYSLNLVIGRKSPLVISLILTFLFYWVNSATRPKLMRFVVGGILGVWAIFSIDFTRGMAIADYGDFDWTRLVNVVYTLLYTNEAYAAHFSLYGVIHLDVPVEPWVSLKFILLSLPPAFLGLPRPDDTYVIYSEAANLTAGQGYSIHQATGWYMNFGEFGILIGAAVWIFLFSRFCKPVCDGALWSKAMRYIGPWTFVAYLPPLLRSSLQRLPNRRSYRTRDRAYVGGEGGGVPEAKRGATTCQFGG